MIEPVLGGFPLRYSLPNLYYKGFPPICHWPCVMQIYIMHIQEGSLTRNVEHLQPWKQIQVKTVKNWNCKWIVSSYDSQTSASPESPLSRDRGDSIFVLSGQGDFFLAAIYTNHPSCDHGYLLHEIFPGPHFYTLLNKILKTSPPCGKEIYRNLTYIITIKNHPVSKQHTTFIEIESAYPKMIHNVVPNSHCHLLCLLQLV